jgi:hypothetical protein
MGDSWGVLDRELAAWADDGRAATLWWRDDDAAAASPALDRLLSLADAHAIAPALAVIPAGAAPSLATLRGPADLRVLQHGYSHRNHAPPSEKKQELGPHRPIADMIGDLRQGHGVLRRMFGDRFLPVLVPPWNRLAPGLIAALPTVGFRALSTYRARRHDLASAGLTQVNAHVDLVDWRRRAFVGDDSALALLVTHLSMRRRGQVDGDEPTGLLTHHLVHDDLAWRFVDRLLLRTRGHAGARWLSPHSAFGLAHAEVPA